MALPVKMKGAEGNSGNLVEDKKEINLKKF